MKILKLLTVALLVLITATFTYAKTKSCEYTMEVTDYKGRYAQARSEICSIVEELQKQVTDETISLKDLFLLMRIHDDHKKFKKAEMIGRNGIRLSQNKSNLEYQGKFTNAYGFILYKNQKYEESYEYLSKAEIMAPSLPQKLQQLIYINLGQLYESCGILYSLPALSRPDCYHKAVASYKFANTELKSSKARESLVRVISFRTDTIRDRIYYKKGELQRLKSMSVTNKQKWIKVNISDLQDSLKKLETNLKDVQTSLEEYQRDS
jgi:tetratricopeptide (TPR) repeat protein